MKGYILDYSVQDNRGIISGDDNQRYSFNGADWMDSEPPRRGMQVDFAATGDQAAQIYVAIGAGRPYAYGGGAGARYSKSKIAAGLLGIFSAASASTSSTWATPGPALFCCFAAR